MPSVLPLLLLALQQSAPSAEPPRLVVMIAVDQLIPEQMQRLAPELQGGFGRFVREGTFFWRATVDYANTETGPGHATFGTGRWPQHTGIVGNMLYDRAEKRLLYCCEDASAHPVTSAGMDASKPAVSPARLIGNALGDILAGAFPGSKTIAIAGKDRSAILMGGKKPAAALWWNPAQGGFTSSSYYGEKLPEFAQVWNRQWAERARGWRWDLEAKGDLAALGTAADDRPGETSRGGRKLPRTLPAEDAALGGAVLFSPLVDYFTIELATLALQSLELGRDAAPDLLAISLSGCDILGHSYGPDSVEVTDLLLRDDRQLATFFATLDEKVGKGRWVACLSSDHGVLDLPESLQGRLVGARRVAGAEVNEMKKGVEAAVEAVHPGAKLGLAYAELGFTIDEEAARAAGIDAAGLRELIAESAEECEWVEDAYTLEELLATDEADPWLTLFRRCQTPERGPDVALRAAPWLLFGMAEGTSHGTPYPYDRRVPLAFLGAKVKAEARFDAASPTDAVPTLLGLVGAAAPADLDGRRLEVGPPAKR